LDTPDEEDKIGFPRIINVIMNSVKPLDGPLLNSNINLSLALFLQLLCAESETVVVIYSMNRLAVDAVRSDVF